MFRTPLASRTVVSAGYDASSLTLELEFATGRIYLFDRVPQAVYDWLLRTPSKGGYVSRMINGRYPHREITVVTTETRDLEAELRASLEDMAQRASAPAPEPRQDATQDATPDSALEQALRASLNAAEPASAGTSDDAAKPSRRNRRDPKRR